MINEKRENDYVKNWSEFSFINGALEAISRLSNIFGNIIVVTNQRGVGRGLMTESDMQSIHQRMADAINIGAGRIDKIYYCTDVLDTSEFRKPNIGMGIRAKLDFTNIDFTRSVMIGDSLSDMNFGRKLGITCYMVNKGLVNSKIPNYEKQFKTLNEWADLFC